MAALDTNVLVRFLVRDDNAQLAAVRHLLEKIITAGEALFVPVTVVLEAEWVLRSSYEFAKDEVVKVLAALLSTVELSFESEQALEVALQTYRDGAADFADCVHIALAAQAGELPLWTFDKRAARIAGAQAIGTGGFGARRGS